MNLNEIIKIKPYTHQIAAAQFAYDTLTSQKKGGDENAPLKHSGTALLMEM